MCFFRLKKLLAELQADPANDSRTFKYFLAHVLVVLLLILLTILNPQHPSKQLILVVIATIFVKLLGLIYCYIVNGGKNGKYFFHRLFPVLWVMLFRIIIPLFLLFILLAPPIFKVLGMNSNLHGTNEQLIIGLFSLTIRIIYWWFVAKQIKHLATQVA